MNRLEEFLQENGLALIGKLSKGWTSEVFLVQDSEGRTLVLKALRDKSNRRDMVAREAGNLKLANSVGVGPRIVKADTGANVVAMEYIDGVPFSEWLGTNPPKNVLNAFIDELYSQAKRLDGIGLDHGQLAGRGHNILVRNGLPVIIDFEKASTRRKCHNVKVLDSFIFRSQNSAVVKKIREILGDEVPRIKTD